MKTANNTKTLLPNNWQELYKISGISAIVIILLIPLQLAVFVLWPPPKDPIGFYTLFHENSFLGLLNLDLLYILSNTLLLFLYLGFYFTLRELNYTYSLIALILGFIGIASYNSSTIAFEMFSLSKQYSNTNDPELQFQLVVAGKVMLEHYKGTAFDIYYILNAISLLITSVMMFRSEIFSRQTAIWGLISAGLMSIPTTVGAIGLFFGIASLIPWIIFSLLVAKVFFRLRKIEN